MVAVKLVLEFLTANIEMIALTIVSRRMQATVFPENALRAFRAMVAEQARGLTSHALAADQSGLPEDKTISWL